MNENSVDNSYNSRNDIQPQTKAEKSASEFKADRKKNEATVLTFRLKTLCQMSERSVGDIHLHRGLVAGQKYLCGKPVHFARSDSDEEQTGTPAFRAFKFFDTPDDRSDMSAEYDRNILSRPQDIVIKEYKVS